MIICVSKGTESHLRVFSGFCWGRKESNLKRCNDIRNQNNGLPILSVHSICSFFCVDLFQDIYFRELTHSVSCTSLKQVGDLALKQVGFQEKSLSKKNKSKKKTSSVWSSNLNRPALSVPSGSRKTNQCNK